MGFFKKENFHRLDTLFETQTKIFLEKAEKKLLKKRFNFLLSENQDEYLNSVSQKENISKAYFIRRLIDEALEKEKK